MRKYIAIAMFMAAFSAGAVVSASASESGAASCLARYGSQVLPEKVDEVDRQCKKFLVRPDSEHPRGLWQFSGDKVREVAVNCNQRYRGKVAFADVSNVCRVFYFPNIPGKGAATHGAIVVPVSE